MDYRDNHHRIAKLQLKWPSFTPPRWPKFTPPLTSVSQVFPPLVQLEQKSRAGLVDPLVQGADRDDGQPAATQPIDELRPRNGASSLG